MGTKDPRVDAYIAKSAEFARPILNQLRQVVHAACPEVEETLKWGAPHFMYRGMLCGMAAFKQHCTFGFWKGKLVLTDAEDKSGEAMGHLGRLSRIADLPKKKVLVDYIKRAMVLNEEGVKPPTRSKPTTKRELTIPADLVAALKDNPTARATFERFSPSHKREYVEWIVEAKRVETRQRRLETTIQWLTEGKPRHWKYKNC